MRDCLLGRAHEVLHKSRIAKINGREYSRDITDIMNRFISHAIFKLDIHHCTTSNSRSPHSRANAHNSRFSLYVNIKYDDKVSNSSSSYDLKRFITPRIANIIAMIPIAIIVLRSSDLKCVKMNVTIRASMTIMIINTIANMIAPI